MPTGDSEEESVAHFLFDFPVALMLTENPVYPQSPPNSIMNKSVFGPTMKGQTGSKVRMLLKNGVHFYFIFKYCSY